MPDATAETVARALIEHWVSRFGTPATITHDRGRQFQSALLTALANLLGCRSISTTAYHPQANGMVERFHRQLKASLKAQPEPDRWQELLPLILLGIRASIKADLGCTSAELVYGTTLCLPGQMIAPTPQESLDPADYVQRLKRHMAEMAPTETRAQPRTSFVPPSLATCSHVFLRVDAVRKPLQPPYTGPFKVLRRTPKYFVINQKNKSISVSIDRLKPAFLESELQATPTPQPAVNEPPRRYTTSERSRSQTPHPTTTPVVSPPSSAPSPRVKNDPGERTAYCSTHHAFRTTRPLA